LARLNRGWLDDVTPVLKQYGLMQFRIVARSSDDWAQYSLGPGGGTVVRRVPTRAQRTTPARPIAAERLEAAVDAPAIASQVVALLWIHDQPLNTSLDQLALAGSTVHMADVIEPAAALLSVLDVLEKIGIKI